MKSLSMLTHDANCMISLRSGGTQVVWLPGSVQLAELKLVAPELTRGDQGALLGSCNGRRSLISSITLPIRSSFFVSDFASRIAVFGCILFSFIAITAVEENMQHWPCLFSASTTSASKKCVVALRYPYARHAFPDFPISRFPDFPISDVRTGLRHCLVLATADPTLAALRPVHDHARTEQARHARCTRASLASDARALTLQHALARQHARMSARVTGH